MTVILNYKLNDKQLIDIVEGRDTSLSRDIAINMLSLSNIQDQEEILNKLILNESENVQARRLAAVNLWKMNTPASYNVLIKAAQKVKNEEVLEGIVKALGRIGDKNTLDTIITLEKRAKGYLKDVALFAASLISYRNGLDGNDLPIPETYLPMPSKEQIQLHFSIPDISEADIFMSSMSKEPCGISFSADLMQQFTCPGGGWILALNKQLSNGNALTSLARSKAMLGVLASKNSEDGRYSATHFILSSPGKTRGNANILVYRIIGKVAWAGEVTSIEANQAKFKLHTAGSLGVIPLEMEGILLPEGKLNVIKAISASRVAQKQHPTPHTD